MGELSDFSDRYLAHHGLTAESVAFVNQVVDKFEFMVSLALQRAQTELGVPELPSNVVMLHGPAHTAPEAS